MTFYSKPRPVGEDELQAYADGRLATERRSEVEAYLAAHPEEFERLEAYRLQNIGLHALFDRSVGETMPTPLERAGRHLHALVARQRLWRRAAACLAAVLVTGTVGWWGLKLGMPPAERGMTVAHPPVEASHPEPRDPPRVAAEVAQDSLVGWLVHRVSGGQPDWPDLRPFGLTLRAERMAAGTAGLAVVLSYEDSAGRPLALHIDLDGDDLPLAASSVREEEAALYWRAGPLVLGLVSVLDRAELLRIADAVTDQITAAGPHPGMLGQNQLLSVQVEAVENGTEAIPGPLPETTETDAPPDGAPAAEQPPAGDDQGVQTDGEQARPSANLPRQRGRTLTASAGGGAGALV